MSNIDRKIKFISTNIISYRRRFIQYTKESYVWCKYPLNDSTLHKHIVHQSTVGVFSGSKYTKFICFDVDTKYNSVSDTKHLINILRDDIGISDNQIYTFYSGNKGYHVYLFFDNLVLNKYTENMYYHVLSKTGFNIDQVEYRPQHKLGVKLPLGLHPVTKRYCGRVDNYFLNLLENEDWLESINTISSEFMELEYGDGISFSTKEVDMFNKVKNSITLDINKVEKHQEHIEYILTNNLLKFPSTRNIMTLVLSCFLKSQGYEIKDTISIINSVMLNTKKELPMFIDSSETHIQSETAKITNHVYKNNYSYKLPTDSLFFSYEEVMDILDIGSFPLMRMYFIHLVQNKRHGVNGIYYMAYSTMQNMGAPKNITQDKKQIDKLSEKIEVVSRNVIDIDKSYETGVVYKKPNVYKIKNNFRSNGLGITVEADIDFESFLCNCNDNIVDLEGKLSKYMYNKIIAQNGNKVKE